MFGFTKRRRDKLRAQPVPPEWLTTLRAEVPYFNRLTAADQAELLGHVHVFLAEKSFEGCGGFEMTDEMRLMIAAQACVLLLHRDTEYFSALQSVLVYPHAFVVDTIQQRSGKLVLRGEEVRMGEAWVCGVVILSWDGVLRGVDNDHDGHNVVFHEFAHQLDMENGDADGFPYVQDREFQERWTEVLSEEYAQLVRDTDVSRPTIIDYYGAKNPAEFFAVTTECFFEIPHRLRKYHPELYEVFSAYYAQDPATYFGG